MKFVRLLGWISALALAMAGCDDDGGESTVDAGAVAPTCDSVCAMHTECLVASACVEACLAEEASVRDPIVTCLNMADPADCDDVSACLPDEPPEGACYFRCEPQPLQGCASGSGITEEVCTADGEMDCDGPPADLVFLPDCACDEGEGDCAPPEWRVTD